MGEIADMMLDGTMCQQCGVWMHEGEDGPGFPQTCSDCRQSNNRAEHVAAGQEKIACPICKKRVKKVGLQDHQRDAHGQAS